MVMQMSRGAVRNGGKAMQHTTPSDIAVNCCVMALPLVQPLLYPGLIMQQQQR